MAQLEPPSLISFNSRICADQTEIHSRRHEEIYREHGMDGWILNYTRSGVGTINRKTAPFNVTTGDLVLFPPTVRHDYGAAKGPGEWTHDWVYFFPRSGWQELLQFPEDHAGVRRLTLEGNPVRQRIAKTFGELILATKSAFVRRDALAMNLLESILLWADSVNPVWTEERIDPRIRSALNYIATGSQRPLTLQDIARHVALSVSRLAHLFRAQVGVTPMEYLEERRVGQARELLLMTEQPVSWIAGEVGFEDPLYFSRVFRRRTGKSPKNWRSDARLELGGLKR